MHSLYDTFFCQEPGREDPFSVTSDPEDRTSLLEIYQKSVEYFAERKRIRTVERLQYEAALLHIQSKQWKRALKILVPLWQNLSWRQAGWWHLLEGVDLALRDCAREAGDADILVAVEWELLSNCRFAPINIVFALEDGT